MQPRIDLPTFTILPRQEETTFFYVLHETCYHDVTLEAYTFAAGLRTVCKCHCCRRIVWGVVVYILGHSRPTRGIAYRIKHMREPDVHARLQGMLPQLAARKRGFDFDINCPSP